jgi:DNA-binding CsgD family transcriptional regulator/PAS domain-containing protein
MRDPADQLLPLVEKLYDAAGGQAGWEGFLDALATTLRGVIPAIYLHDRPIEPATLAVTVGMDPTWGAAYDGYYINHDLRRRKIWTLPPGGVFVGSALVPDEELLRSEFYNDFLRPQGFFHILGAVPVKTDDAFAVLRVIRQRSSPAFGREELEFVRRLVPHLARAVGLSRQLALAAARRDELVEALDWFPTAVMLLDRRGRIVAANRSAEDLLAAGDGLRSDRDGLRAAAPGDTLALRRMLATAAEPTAQGSAHGDGTLSIARPSPRRPLNLLVAPLRTPIVPDARARARVAVFVTDPDRVAIAPVERLQHYLGVTRAEADLVMWLVQGHRLEEAADELGITVNTARTQLKRALAKTGTGRQAELVRLALSTPATLGVQTYEQDRARASTAASRPRRRME